MKKPSTRLQKLLEQLTPEERNGAILEVALPPGTKLKSRSTREIRAVVREAVVAKAVSEALAKARKQAGLKAKDVAQNLNISAPRVSQLESLESNPTLSTLLQHAHAVGCEVEIILRPRDPKLPLVITAL